MSAPTSSRPWSHSLARFGGLIVGVAVVLIGIWAISGSEAHGSDVLIVIEDASQEPVGLFPGTVCYEVVRQFDDVIVTQGCLAFAASIAAPAGFDRGMLYTLDVTVNSEHCTLLDDLRVGSGVVPFKVRVSCYDADGERVASEERANQFVAAGASPIAQPERSAP